MKGIKDPKTGKFIKNVEHPIRKCKFCYKEYLNRDKRRKFCSRKCEIERRIKDRNRLCIQCGKNFCSYTLKTRFCSHKCYGDSGVGTRKGELNNKWKGGITPKNTAIRNSKEYKLWRIAVFQRDNYTCIWCGNNKSGNLNADHIKPFSLFPELRFAIDNGRTLCIDCHKTTDSYLNNKLKHYVL